MLEFIGTAANVPFVSAFVLMIFIGIAQLAGLGGGADLDADATVHGPLDWLGIGRLPLLLLLIVFLAQFAMIGLVGQQLLFDLTGALLTPWLAAPLAGVAALPLTGLAARGLARILPTDHTTATTLDTLIGRGGEIVVGRARLGSPARARVADHHGQDHYVMVEPDASGQVFETGDPVILVRRDGNIFRAIVRGDYRLPRLD